MQYANNASNETFTVISTKGLHYIFYVFIGVMIANSTLVTVIAHGPSAVVSKEELKDASPSEIYYDSIAIADTSMAPKIFWPLVYFIVAIFAYKTGSVSKAFTEAPIFLIGFIILIFASTLWSETPIESVKRAVHFLGKTLIAYQLTRYLTLNGIITYLRDCLFIVAIIAAGTALLYPDIGIHPEGREAWRGLYTNKNALGHSMALYSILCLHFFCRSNYLSWFHGITLVLSLLVVTLSQSATAIATLAVASCIYFAAFVSKLDETTKKRRANTVIVGVMLSIVSAYLVYKNWEFFVSLLDRRPTLSGRTLIWEGAWEMIRERPIIGYGYFAAWSSTDIWSLYATTGFWTPSAHNAFIESWLDLGIIGVTLFVCFLIYTIFLWGRKYLALGSTDLLITGVLFMMLILLAITEAALYKSREINWFMWALLSIHFWQSQSSLRTRLIDRFARFFHLDSLRPEQPSINMTIEHTKHTKVKRKRKRKRRIRQAHTTDDQNTSVV